MAKRASKKMTGDASIAVAPQEQGEKQSGTLQTLDRGLQVLGILARDTGGESVAALAAELGVHRTIAYRLVATLEQHGLVSRGVDGQLRLGASVLALANKFVPQLRTISQQPLQALAQRTGATAFLSIAEGRECVAIAVSEPDDVIIRVAYRVGSRHPLELGAAGIAILSSREARADDPDAVKQARQAGYCITRGQIQPGAVGVASAISASRSFHGGLEASVGVVALEGLEIPLATQAVMDCSKAIALAAGV